MLLNLLLVEGNILFQGLVSVQVVHSVWMVEDFVQQLEVEVTWEAGGGLLG